MILSHHAGQGQQSAAPSQPCAHKGKQRIPYSVFIALDDFHLTLGYCKCSEHVQARLSYEHILNVF